MTRRDLIKTAVGAFGAALTAPMGNRGRYDLFAGAAGQYSARAIDLVGRTATIDMMGVFNVRPGIGADEMWLSDPDRFTPADWQQFKDASISVYSGGPGLSGYDSVLRYLARWNGFLAHHADRLMRIDSTANLDRVKGSGKIGVLLAVQNSDHFRNVNDVEFFHALGQRVSQLTYNERNLIGNGCTARRDDGLSDFGVAVVERMNKLGMAIDVSHSGDRTTLDAIEVSTKPVLITHSNCRALNPGHPRCKTDETITKLAYSGSR